MKAKLNHKKIDKIMKSKGIRQRDLVKKWGKSYQLTYYIVKKGSIKFAELIANELGVEAKSIILVE
jgi:lambda repressor-like predicted transcriptional regulator